MVPGFDNSAMDGYAVRASDTSSARPSSAVRLRTVDESRAGSPANRVLEPGQAIAISTGAALPRGADAIVRVEDTQRVGAEVDVHAAAAVGQHVRAAGGDIQAEELVLAAGTTIGPFALGVL